MQDLPKLPRKLRLLAVPPNEGGCAQYRVIIPCKKIQEALSDYIEVRFNKNPLEWRQGEGTQIFVNPDSKVPDIEWADIVFTCNIHDFGPQYNVQLLDETRKRGKIHHFDTDDLLTDLYEGHRHYAAYKEKKLDELTKLLYEHSNLVTVTQRKFAERVKPYIKSGALAILKNAIDYNLPNWNAPKNQSKPVRIGWVGGIHHEEDVKEFKGTMLAVNQLVGPEKVKWNFFGRPFFPPGAKKDWQSDVWDNYQKILTAGSKRSNVEIFWAQPIDKYGIFYSNIDIAIAPLQYNFFNDSKSDIKVAECYASGTKVLMFDGSIKNVEDVELGDKLMGPDSKERNVIKLFRGKSEMVKIIPKNGKEITVTTDHLLHLKTNRLKKREEFLTIKVKDYDSLYDLEKYDYNLYRSEVEFPHAEVLLEPYFIGAMLGDGSLLKTPRIITMDEEIREYFSNYCLSVGEEKLHINAYGKQGSKASTYSAGLEPNSGPSKNPIIEKLKFYKLYKVSCKNKFIPKQYLINSRKNRLELLAGLIDTDGCLIKSSYQFSNSSKQLINDVAFLARSLGFRVSGPEICKKYNEKGELFLWERLQISGPIHLIPCKIARKQHKQTIKKKIRNPLTTGFKIEKLSGDREFFGFQLDGDNLHLLDDFTVMHNCGRYAIPLVCTNMGCYDETIKNGETGFLISRENSIMEWKNRLSYLIRNPKEITRMGSNLKKITDDAFDLNKVVVNRYLLYLEILRLFKYEIK
jgi:glycosyltransferase involved in cell wall biosynthesis